MKFYDRENELSALQTLWEQADTEGRLAVLTGRRRLGKTLLAKEFASNRPYFYLFIEKKTENLLCDDLLNSIKDQVPVYGEIKRFKDLFAILLDYAKQKKITLIIDEFQEFFSINPSVFSEIQNLWDAHKKTSKMLFIAIGSVYSLMNKIFEDLKEPLFGRADRIIKLKPFSIPTLIKVLKDHHITDIETVFDFYMLTGSSPKYLDLLMTNKIRTKKQILWFMLSEFSPFLDEGKNLLIEEFGKEYGTYFAILELLSRGKTSRPEIESILGYSIGGHIEKLENTYHLIERVLPITEKPASRMIKFSIKDPFINFWFRFINRNRSAIELKNFDYILRLIERDYAVYSGKWLEKFFIEILSLQKKYNKIGTYWESKNENEIDIVAINDLDKQLLIAEMKRNPKKHNLFALQTKAQKIIKEYPGYEIEWKEFSLKDAKELLL